MIEIKSASEKTKADAYIVLFDKVEAIPATLVVPGAKKKIKQVELKKPLTLFDGNILHLYQLVTDSKDWKNREQIRKNAASAFSHIKSLHLSELVIFDYCSSGAAAKAYCEGMVLGSYSFCKYKTDKKTTSEKSVSISLSSKNIKTAELKELNILLAAVGKARDLVNEPNSYLTAPKLSEEFTKMGKDAGFQVEVWNEAKIKAQKMGGILGVNSGSTMPPTFNIMEYKPKGAKNKKPYVLVGKGVVYDTGGMSLKPTANSMDYMKCDMAGAAAVAGVLYAVAKAKLPLHMIGLVPATDNRPGEEAIVPGDIITMYSGHTVEVKNTDAEGRLILADALQYAKKLNPELVIDLATLTGAAVRAIGSYASAIMGTASEKVFDEIEATGYNTFDRLIRFPLWDEYGDELKSEIADFSNLGKGEGGQMSAGKFLEKFTDYPWLHLDIAGTAFMHSTSDYRPAGGTGVGVRLIFEYLKTKI
ncbi:MAG: leucyl aminopeptidase [Bacteroidia bacterium]|nr:leucyl aminopeptidase [Bacteroidia bacterium]MCO5254691.1 leucyl aminopeptidase [Bacteroidota bacterium]